MRSDDSWTARVNKPRGAIIDPRPEWPPFARSGVDVKHPLRIAALDASTGRTPALRRPRCNGKNAQIADTGRTPERAKAKGTASIQVGGCDDKISNCLPIMKGWNYTVRLSDLICPVRLIAQSATGEQHFDQEGDEGAHCEKQRQTKGHE